MYSSIDAFILDSVVDVELTEEREELLDDTVKKIREHLNQPLTFLFVCTHNSRRSQFAQVFAHVLNQSLLKKSDLKVQSAGTEVTACNPRTIAALEEIGFEVGINEPGDNPVYHVLFDDYAKPIKLWSKTVHDDAIEQPVIAIMTCSHADENCPLVPGALERIPLKYVDPKRADDTDEEMDVYLETAGTIAAELHYFFSRLV